MSLMALVDRDLQSVDGITITTCHCAAAAGMLAACMMQCANPPGSAPGEKRLRERGSAAPAWCNTVSLMLQAPDGSESSPTEHLCSADSDRLVTLCIAMVGALNLPNVYKLSNRGGGDTNTGVKQLLPFEMKDTKDLIEVARCVAMPETFQEQIFLIGGGQAGGSPESEATLDVQ